MAITFVNAGTRVSSAGATSATPALPASRVTGNLLIAVVGTKNNAVHSTSTDGWAKLDQRDSGTGWTLSIFYRNVSGSETAPVITWTGSVANFAIQFQYTGGATSSPIGNFLANNGTGSPHTNSGTTATRDASQFIYIGGSTANTAYGTTANWTENNDAGSNTGATRQVAGRRNATLNTGQSSGSISITGATGAWVLYQIELLEPDVINDTVTPDRTDFTLSAFEPTIEAIRNSSISIDRTDYSFQSFEPTVNTQRNISITPDRVDFGFTTFDPTVELATNVIVIPDITDYTLQAFEPTVQAQRSVLISIDRIDYNLQSFEPTIQTQRNVNVSIDRVNYSFQSFEPTVIAQINTSFTPDRVNLTLEAFEPTVKQSSDVIVTTDRINYTLEAFEPIVSTQRNAFVSIPIVNFAFQLFEPTIQIERSALVQVDLVDYLFTSFDPTVVFSDTTLPQIIYGNSRIQTNFAGDSELDPKFIGMSKNPSTTNDSEIIATFTRQSKNKTTFP